MSGAIVIETQSLLLLGVEEETERLGILPKVTQQPFLTLSFELSLGVTGPLLKGDFVPDEGN